MSIAEFTEAMISKGVEFLVANRNISIPLLPHGSYSNYTGKTHGCRCELCTTAYVEYRKKGK